MKLNNKGFAITGLIYSAFLLVIFFITFGLLNVSMKGISSNKLKKDVQTELNNLNVISLNNNGVNAPRLVKGLTAIKWVNGVEEEVVDHYNEEWYNYEKKEWANAKSEDGSYWVWIPRYAYSIRSGYHTSVAGEIDIKFLIGKSKVSFDNEIKVEEKPLYNGDKQTNYVAHPAFTFGENEVTGFWVAKFEMSEANNILGSLPNKTPLINITLEDIFNRLRDLENRAVYGWNSNNVDTHLTKDMEWGAIAYLSKSKYGKDKDEVWINPTLPNKTGCAGDSVSSNSTSLCNDYKSVNGVKASTSGTIYGVYDMSGGVYEYTAAYVETTDTNLLSLFPGINNVESKYVDRYKKSPTNDGELNYELNKDVFGNAMYETSSGISSYGWFQDFLAMPSTTGVFQLRGTGNTNGAAAGLFSFHRVGPARNHGFRAILIVK